MGSAHGRAWPGRARQGLAGLGAAGRGGARRGKAWQGKAAGLFLPPFFVIDKRDTLAAMYTRSQILDHAAAVRRVVAEIERIRREESPTGGKPAVIPVLPWESFRKSILIICDALEGKTDENTGRIPFDDFHYPG